MLTCTLLLEKEKETVEASWKDLEIGATAKLSGTREGGVQIELSNGKTVRFARDIDAIEALISNGFILTPGSAVLVASQLASEELRGYVVRLLPTIPHD